MISAERISRLRKMAEEAITQYTADCRTGDPVYPAWADDVIAVLDELSMVKRQLANILERTEA